MVVADCPVKNHGAASADDNRYRLRQVGGRALGRSGAWNRSTYERNISADILSCATESSHAQPRQQSPYELLLDWRSRGGLTAPDLASNELWGFDVQMTWEQWSRRSGGRICEIGHLTDFDHFVAFDLDLVIG